MQVCCITNPIWVIKTRLQLQRRPGPGLARAAHLSGHLRSNAMPYTGLVHAVKQIAKEEGLKGFYKGLLPSLLLVRSRAVLTDRCVLHRCEPVATQHLARVCRCHL